jgi:protein CWC15
VGHARIEQSINIDLDDDPDADDVISSASDDLDSEDDGEDSEDETELLMRELEKIKRERAEEKERQEKERLAKDNAEKEVELLSGNPLLNIAPGKVDFHVKRR